MTLQIQALTEPIAAEVRGVDVTEPISDETFSQLRTALYRHAVLVFHDQDITDEQQVTFTWGFGTVENTIPSDPIGDGGPVGVISNVDENGDIIPPDDDRIAAGLASARKVIDGRTAERVHAGGQSCPPGRRGHGIREPRRSVQADV